MLIGVVVDVLKSGVNTSGSGVQSIVVGVVKYFAVEDFFIIILVVI